MLHRNLPGRLLRLAAPALLILAALEPQCLAQTAAQQLQLGIRSYTRGNFDRAVERLGAAARATTDPKQLAQIHLFLGFSHALLQQQEPARRAFATALLYDPDLRPDPRRFKSELLALFDDVRDRLGLLSVTSDQPGSRVVVDGHEIGQAPLRCRLAAGPHRVELRADSGTQRRSVDIGAGGSTSVAFQLPAALTKGARPAPAGHSFWRRRRVWTWVALGGAVLCLGAGIGLGATAKSSYDGSWVPMRDSYLRGEAGREGLQSLGDSVSAKSTAANVLFGVGGALAVTSLVLLFTEGREAAAEARLAWH